MNILRTYLLPLFILLLVSLPLRATNIAWDGGGDGISWSDPVNWVGDALPGGADHAVITMNGTYTVRLTANASVAGITLGGASGKQTLDVNGFQLSLGTDTSVVNPNGLLIVGGITDNTRTVLSIDGPLNVIGQIDWTNGRLYANTYYQPPNGRLLTITPNGTMRWLGSGARYIDATLINEGTLTWVDGTTWYTQGHTVSSSGVFDIALANDALFGRTGINSLGPWVFTNTGTIRKTGPGAATLQVELTNIGATIDVQQDTLLQNYRSRWENTTVSVSVGATLELSANRTFEPHTVSGTLSGNIAGTFMLTGLGFGYFTTLDADTATGGIVNITGTGLQLNEASVGGEFYSPANIYSKSPVNRGLMRFVGKSDKFIYGEFVNQGTLQWEDGRLYYYVTSSGFTNQGTFNMMISDTVDFLCSGINGGRPGPFINTGTVIKSLGGKVFSNVDFHNIGGNVDVRGGLLQLEWDTRWERANISVDAGATLQLCGYQKRHLIVDTLRGTPQGTFLVAGISWSYNALLIADSARGGRLEIHGTGVQLDNAEIGGPLGERAPVNGGLLRFINNSPNKRINTSFRNEDTMRWEAGSIFIAPNITVTNAGLFEVTSNGGSFNGSTFNGCSTLDNLANATIRKTDTGTSTFITSINNYGRFCIRSGTILIDNAFNNLDIIRLNYGGILSGSGTLDVSRFWDSTRLFNDGLTVPGPGDDGTGVGTLAVRGPLPHHRYRFEIAGKDSAQYDRLIVGNPSDLSTDTADVTIINGFTPFTGNFFDVITGPVTDSLNKLTITPATVRLTDTYPPNLLRLIFGDGEPARVQVLAPRIAARQNDLVSLPITVIATDAARGSGVSEATLALRYNVTLLAPIESTPKGSVLAKERSIPLRIPIPLSADTTVTTLRFRAALGNDSVTVLSVDSAAVNVSGIPVISVPGEFKLLDLCREGGARLLNPDGIVTLSKVRTAPAGHRISFDLNLIENGKTKIVLVDMSGDVAATLVDGELPRGERTMDFDVGRIASGRYFLIVQTPTVVLIEQTEVLQ